MGSGNLGGKGVDLFWLVIGTPFSAFLSVRGGSVDTVGNVKITSGLVWSSGLWCGIVMWDGGSWLLSSAWGTRFTVSWSVSSIADLSSTVDTVWAVGSVARWESSNCRNLNWVPLRISLGVVEWLSLHGNVLAEIFITIHSSGEKFVIGWST